MFKQTRFIPFEPLLPDRYPSRLANFVQETPKKEEKPVVSKAPTPAIEVQDEFSLDTGQRLYLKSLIS